VWARYDPPFKPWFLRTNEILLALSPPAPDGAPRLRIDTDPPPP
jgi:hypothetical protein